MLIAFTLQLFCWQAFSQQGYLCILVHLSLVTVVIAGLYTIYYRVEGPISSFPSPLSSTTALSSFSASVGSSMSFPATYPSSNIQTSVIKTLPNTRRSTISSSGSATAAAVTPKVTNTQAVVFMSQFSESKELSLEIEFLLLASAALMSLTSPYGPGLSVQRSDANGNILDLVGELWTMLPGHGFVLSMQA
jgi:hypothetical protein